MLAINRESMLFDPINWGEFKSRLLEWAENRCSTLKINAGTERLSRKGSTPPREKGSEPYPAPYSIYNFFDPDQDFRTETNLLQPNQLRELLKLQNPAGYDAALEDFSKELFWSGYKIWRTRKEKMKNFWKYSP